MNDQKVCTDPFCLTKRQATGHPDPLCPQCGGAWEVTADAPTSVGENRISVTFLAQAGD